MSRAVIPVILSGGSGTRLWPLSRADRPKQFLRLVTEHSLLQDTLLRTRGLEERVRAPIVVCNESHRFLVAEQLREIGIEPEAIVLEPQGRNTAPAVAVAALLARRAARSALPTENRGGGSGMGSTARTNAGGDEVPSIPRGGTRRDPDAVPAQPAASADQAAASHQGAKGKNQAGSRAQRAIRKDQDASLARRAKGEDHAASQAEPPAGSDEDPILLVLPADHVLRDAQAFVAAIEDAIAAAETGGLVTFGVVPDRPETGYGYILRGEDRGRHARVERFVEKPNLDTAERYLRSGDYLWNSGMFVFSAETYLRELERHAEAMVDACTAAVDGAVAEQDFLRLGAAFASSPSDSIDYAVMERTDRAMVVALDAGWSDVGSWAALHDVLDRDGDGNLLRGDVVVTECRDSYVEANARLVAVVGLKGAVVIETADAVLVMSKRESQRIKDVVEALEQDRRPER